MLQRGLEAQVQAKAAGWPTWSCFPSVGSSVGFQGEEAAWGSGKNRHFRCCFSPFLGTYSLVPRCLSHKIKIMILFLELLGKSEITHTKYVAHSSHHWYNSIFLLK